MRTDQRVKEKNSSAYCFSFHHPVTGYGRNKWNRCYLSAAEKNQVWWYTAGICQEPSLHWRSVIKIPTLQTAKKTMALVVIWPTPLVPCHQICQNYAGIIRQGGSIHHCLNEKYSQSLFGCTFPVDHRSSVPAKVCCWLISQSQSKLGKDHEHMVRIHPGAWTSTWLSLSVGGQSRAGDWQSQLCA